MNELREYIRDLAADAREIQPDPDPDELRPGTVCRRLRRVEATFSERSRTAVRVEQSHARQRLEPTNADILRASIETIHDMETLQACVGYENAHQ